MPVAAVVSMVVAVVAVMPVAVVPVVLAVVAGEDRVSVKILRSFSYTPPHPGLFVSLLNV